MADGQFIQRARSFLTEPVFANMEGRTPEDVERRRLWAEQLLGGNGDGQVESWTEGLGNLVNAFVGHRTREGVEREHTRAADASQAMWGNLAGQAFGGGQPSGPSPQAGAAGLAGVTPGAQGRTDGSWMVAGSPNAAAAPEFGTFGGDAAGYIGSLAPGLRTEGLDPTFANRLASAAADFQRETGQPASFTSLARTTEEQAELYRRYQAGEIGLAAPPGQSRHEGGAAADLSGPFLAWMQQNAARYGLEPLSGHAGQIDPGHYQMAGGGGGGAPQAQAGGPNAALIQQLLADPQGAPVAQQAIIQQLFGGEGEGFTLGANETRYDARGNVIAQGAGSGGGQTRDETRNGILGQLGPTGEWAPYPEWMQPNAGAPDPTADQRDYQFYVQQETAAGREPKAFSEWDLERRGRLGGIDPTIGEQRYNLLYQNAARELPVLQQTFASLSQLGNQAADQLPGFIANWLTTPDYQVALDAVTQIVQMQTYALTGAAATESEAARIAITMLPGIGDSPPRLAQKWLRIISAVEQMRQAGGAAAIGTQPFSADPLGLFP